MTVRARREKARLDRKEREETWTVSRVWPKSKASKETVACTQGIGERGELLDG